LEPVDLEIAPGEIVCVSGPSGSGKSRLLRAVADLEPHSGRVRLGEHWRDDMPAHAWRRQVMLVPAESQWWADSVAEHLDQPEPQAIQALGLPEDCPGWVVSRLSSGEKQRLALVRARSFHPCALLLDEPTANLDEAGTARVERWLKQWIEAEGLPVLWVAHDPAQIKRMARRHFVIDHDRLVAG
ncbi:MAG: ATP-binding cassette domain-containing protein, partial [Wenzhouxiangella sp.]